MVKVAGVMAGVFVMGTGAMELMGRMMGGHSEAAALALIGFGLVGSSQLLSALIHEVPAQTPAHQE